MKFNFKSIDECVEIVSMNRIFDRKTMECFRRAMKNRIMPDQCFTNAIMAACWFKERGFDVKTVDGCMYPNEYGERAAAARNIPYYSSKYDRLNNNPLEHRFCVFNGKYFDPTIEFLFGFEPTKWCDYEVYRIFEPQVLIDLAFELKNRFGEYHFFYTETGVTYFYAENDQEIPIHWGYVNENGDYIPPKENPVKFRDELLQKSA